MTGTGIRCTGLTEINIPDSLTEIGDIPGSVKKIGWGAFEGCTGLTEITIPDSVTEIGDRAFSGCTGLTKI